MEMENSAQRVTRPWEKSDWEESARIVTHMVARYQELTRHHWQVLAGPGKYQEIELRVSSLS